ARLATTDADEWASEHKITRYFFKINKRKHKMISEQQILQQLHQLPHEKWSQVLEFMQMLNNQPKTAPTQQD
ncbi:MAG: hypothetical protein VSS52_011125, partial [Thiotrichaceae bacterium]|nr:hypothetical protein [Thiotrichaceae bacterium]